jgi:hypothetical protein
VCVGEGYQVEEEKNTRIKARLRRRVYGCFDIYVIKFRHAYICTPRRTTFSGQKIRENDEVQGQQGCENSRHYRERHRRAYRLRPQMSGSDSLRAAGKLKLPTPHCILDLEGVPQLNVAPLSIYTCTFIC